MAGSLRKLVTVLTLESTKAVKGLKAYDTLWKNVAKGVDSAAASIEKAADRAAAAMAKMGSVSQPRVGGGGGGSRAPSYGAGAAFKNVKRGGDGLGGLGGDYKKIQKDLDGIGDAGKRAAKGISSMGVAAGNLVSMGISSLISGIGGAMKGVVNEAVKFESGMADVAKVVDGLKGPNGEVTAEFHKMEDTILGLSKKIAKTPEEFTKIYAAAGEAGIAKEELDRFAESAAKSGVALGISAEDAGSGMAKLRSGLQLSQDGVESLFGTFNHLSNNMAINAEQAMEITLKAGGVGAAAKVSAQEVAGLGAAMVASGAQSDVAATATKNYIMALSSGETATTRQRDAFAQLGMSAEDVAKKFTGSAQQRLAVQREILEKIAKLSDDERVSALSNLFGKESLGAIAGITGNLGNFEKAMSLAMNTTAAATSVQDEYNVRSQTTENAIQLLKNNVSALAIEFGTQLLPYLNKIIDFLTSEEGQDWGKKAVAKAVTVVTTLADGVVTLVGFFSDLTETLGGTGVAIAGVGVAAMALAAVGGPFALMGAAAAAVGYGMAYAFDKASEAILGKSNKISAKMLEIMNLASDIRHKEHEAEMKENQKEVDDQIAGVETHSAIRSKAEGLAKRYEEAELKKLGKNATEEQKLKVFRNANRLKSEVEYGGGNRTLGSGMAEDRLAAFENLVDQREGAGGPTGSKRKRFDQLSAKVRAGKPLRPSEQTEYTALSKDLDAPKAHRAPKGKERFGSTGQSEELQNARFEELGSKGKTRTPSEDREYNRLSKDLDRRKAGKLSKQEQALAGLDPSLAGILRDDTTGKVHDDVLSKGAFGAATNKHGLGGVDSGKGSVGPGPNITNIYNQQSVTTTVTQTINPGGSGSTAENLASAGQSVAQMTADLVLTGASKVLALKNAGGVL
jgi:TP901 family phage tail tape measure protein